MNKGEGPRLGPGPSAPAVVVQPTVLLVGPQPARLTCPICHAQISTEIRIEKTTKTHMMAALLCLGCCPCVCVPYCIDSCKAKNHYCPNCKAYLGGYNN